MSEKIVPADAKPARSRATTRVVAKAADNKLVRLDKVWADSTVVEANVSYPTDSGLLAKGVAALVR